MINALTNYVILCFHHGFYCWAINRIIVYQFKSIFRTRITDKRLLLAVVLRRREQRINSQLQSILKHVWYESSQERTREFKTRVGVHLNQVKFEFIINHEIQAKNFKGVQTSFRVHFTVHCSKDISGQFIHLRQEISLKAHVEFTVISIQIVLEFVVRHFVARFVFPVAFVSLLHRIIC